MRGPLLGFEFRNPAENLWLFVCCRLQCKLVHCLFRRCGVVTDMRASVPGLVLFLCGMAISVPAQTNYQRLRSFGFPETLGASPRRAPIEASDGRIYGPTFLGGGPLDDDGGGIYRVN